MNWKKILHSGICLLVVLAILLNCVPVKAEAVIVGGGIGAVALSLLDIFGYVFSPRVVEDMIQIGNSFSSYLQEWGSRFNFVSEVDEFLADCAVFDDISVLGTDDFRLLIPETIISAVAGWIYAVVKRDITFDSIFYDGSILSFVPLKYYAFSNSNYGATGVFNPSSYDFSQPVSGGSFDGQIFSVSSASSLGGILSISTEPIKLSEGYYYLDGGNMTLFRPTSVVRGSSSFGVGVIRVDSSGNYQVVSSFTRDYSDSAWENETFSFPYCKFYASSDYSYYITISASFKASFYDEFMGFKLSKPLELISESSLYTDTLEPSVVLGDYYEGVNDGSLSEEDFFYVGLNLAPILQGGSDTLTSMQSLSNQLTSGSLSLQQYQQMVDYNSNFDADVGTGELTGSLAQFPANSFFTTLQSLIQNPIQSLKEGILSGIRQIFVPSEDYLTSKVDTLAVQFPFVAPVVTLARTITLGFGDGEPEPPVIYLHLEDTRGSYDLGGTVPFIDMTWYAEYKPIGDAFLSSLLWVVFIWRLFRQLPGLIAGMPGEYNARILDVLNVTPPSRSLATEVHRQSNREAVRDAMKSKGAGKK